MSWSRKFDESITLSDGTQLETPREAISYLVNAIPKAERDMPGVLAAAQMLTNAAEREGTWVRVSLRFGPSTGTRFASSIRTAKTIIGESGSSRGTNKWNKGSPWPLIAVTALSVAFLGDENAITRSRLP